MPQLQLSEEDTIQLILHYLHQGSFFKAKFALEQEAQVRLFSYGKELDFFYDLLMDGKFEDVEKLVFPLKQRSTQKYNRVISNVKTQKYLEALENSVDPNLEELAKLLKDLEQICEPADFSELRHCLTLNSITEHPKFRHWSVFSGRAQCFEQCLTQLKEIYKLQEPETPKYLLKDLLDKINEDVLYSPRVVKHNSPSMKENERYSSEVQNFDASEGSLVINESENTEQDIGRPNKKQVSWNIPSNQGLQDETSKKVFIETLDLPSGTDEQSVCEEDQGQYRQSSHEIMAKFEPSQLREVAQVMDTNPIRASAFNASGEYFALGTNSKCLKICSMHNIVDELIYDEHQGRDQWIDTVFEMRHIHIGSVYCVDWARSGSQIATGSNDKTIKILYCPDFLQIQETNSDTVIYNNGNYIQGEGDLPQIYETLLSGHQGTVRSVIFNPIDDKVLLSGSITQGDLRVWNTETGQCITRLQGHNGSIFSLAGYGDGSYFASVGTDRKLMIWDIRASRSVMSIDAESFGEMNSVCLNNSAAQMRAETKSKIAQMFINKGSRPTQPSRTNLAAVGHNDGIVTLWDITAGKLFGKFMHHNADCRSVEFSSDNRWLISASFDNSIGIVDMSHNQTFKIEPHDDKVVSAKWHPYLPILLSTGADKTARILAP